MRHVGNSVYEYRIYYKNCETCNGMGERYLSNVKELVQYLRDMRREIGASFVDLIREAHYWKKNRGYARCYDCGGCGKAEEWL
jgi:excinuclease UvrABC ATPase subunit